MTTDVGGLAVGLEVSQWKYLSTEAREHEMHVILTVRVDGALGAAGGPGGSLAEVLVVDCSTSMTWPQEKFRAARAAAAAALRMLPDGTPFAVVQGTDSAAMAYPAGATLAVASPAVRRDAERAVHGLVAAGGTAIGSWLDLCRRLLAVREAPIGHVLLLTDGRNQHDSAMPLARVLDACEGQFVCDAWGIGDGWDAKELLRIAGRLHGSADAVREESRLPDEYRKLMRGLLAKAVPELVIEVAPAPGTTVRYLKQVHPTELELPANGAEGGPASQEFTTRAWGNETRRFQLCLSADPAGRPRLEDLQLAVVTVEVPGGGEVTLPPPRACVVHWTDDPALSQRTDDQVEHFELFGKLGRTVAAASDAHRRGDRDGAERHLGAAVALAHTLGARRQLDDLARLVDIADAPTGRVRLRRDLKAVDFQHLITSSSHSSYGPEPVPSGRLTSTQADALEPCGSCDEPVPVTARFCPVCGTRREARP